MTAYLLPASRAIAVSKVGMRFEFSADTSGAALLELLSARRAFKVAAEGSAGFVAHVYADTTRTTLLQKVKSWDMHTQPFVSLLVEGARDALAAGAAAEGQAGLCLDIAFLSAEQVRNQLPTHLLE